MSEIVGKSSSNHPAAVEGSSGNRGLSLWYVLTVALLISIIVWNFVSFQRGTAKPLIMTMKSSLDRNGFSDLLLLGDNSAGEKNETDDTTRNHNHILTKKKKTTIAYAVTVTDFRSGKHTDKTTLFDRAAVLHQSIKQSMSQSERYDYHIYAFVHPDAVEVQPTFEKLGYRVLVRDTPFNLTQVPNEALVAAQGNSCCGDKEYLKLYSYLLLGYPVVVHLDMDYLVRKPMDDLFDLFVDSKYDRSKFQKSSMWTNMSNYDRQVDFAFTRDYNMVNPGKRKIKQIGTQGGFLVVRPSKEDFDRFVSVILSGGNYTRGFGWGGHELRYGGYYGSGTIQGLASYYYGHLQPNRAIELNRCYYNTMVDDPIHFNKIKNKKICRTLEETCQDCRETPPEDIYSVHFTLCGKPEWCILNSQVPLCRQLFIEWHAVRSSLEREWMETYPGYDPNLTAVAVSNTTDTNNKLEMLQTFDGHCGPSVQLKKYVAMVFPSLDSETETLI